MAWSSPNRQLTSAPPSSPSSTTPAATSFSSSRRSRTRIKVTPAELSPPAPQRSTSHKRQTDPVDAECLRRACRMKTPAIVSPEEWQVAREALLVKEKELTRARDALSAERRRMPWMAVEKEYR